MIILITFLCNFWIVATAEPLVRVDASRIESIAKKAIAEKYADLKSDRLVFDGIWYVMQPDGSDYITASYNLPSSATNKKIVNKGGTINMTETPEVTVTLSNSGKVTNVSKSVHQSFTTNTK
jgi:hypothetical protein